MRTTEPHRCQDVDDLMGALIEERARNPLLGSDALAVDSGADGDPFTIDGIRGLCFTSRELESYVQNAEEIRTELVEHHTGCVSVLEHVGKVDAERRATRQASEERRRDGLRYRRLLRELLAVHDLPCDGVSTDSCVRCRIYRTLGAPSEHTYPSITEETS